MPATTVRLLAPALIAALALVDDVGWEEHTGGGTSKHDGNAGLSVVPNKLGIFNCPLKECLLGTRIISEVRPVRIDDVLGEMPVVV